jgi:small-conductance mechanosensitive channel
VSNGSEFLSLVFLGNNVRSWAYALLAFLFVFTVLPIVKSFVAARRRKWGERNLPVGVELATLLVSRTSAVFLWAVALYAGERFLDLPPRVERISTILIVIIAWLQVALWASTAVRFALDRQHVKNEIADAGFSGSLDVIMFLARILIFAIAFLLALDNLGINITALVAGLGIGGIAIALAVQTVLGDLLASLSIALDKPFVTGDVLKIDDYEGAVEHIGIKSTRLRSVSGEQIILSNADVLKSRVRNLGRMPERRVLFLLGIDYATSRAQLQSVPQLVETVVRRYAGARFEYCVLKTFGESALTFEVCYFILEPQGRTILAMQHGINEGIFSLLADNAIHFAHPMRTVTLRSRQ